MDLDQLRAQKLAELQKRQQEAALQEHQIEQQVAQLENAVKGVLSPEARARLANIKLVSPDKAVQVMVVIAQLVQAGRMSYLDDAALKELLVKLQPEQKKTKIIRK